MHEIPFSKVRIQDPFWSPRLEMNANLALEHQWRQLEQSGCIQNFRLLADNSSGIRRGWFFADSDAYKWLEAAVIGYAQNQNGTLSTRIQELIALIQRAQAPDGYLYTYNQLIFPESRWQNLQIEHELYCHGHLIEAAVTHFQITGETHLLQTATKAADLIVTTFSGKGSLFTPGHEEVEIALLRLFEVTGNQAYLQMAQQFLDQRGRHAPTSFLLHMLGENKRVNQRTKQYQLKHRQFDQENPDVTPGHVLPPPNRMKSSRLSKLRFMVSALNGKYFQQHALLEKQVIPVGHAVRFVYLQTAAAKLIRLSGKTENLSPLQKSWQRMITRRMALTGGIGSLPFSEGFGRDYELDPEMMYAETCAALGSMFWNWEMSLLTQEAAYADLFERQLYNASLVGIGQEGNCYLYNNPLQSREGMLRQPWFEIPCCPSNLSRTWGKMGGYLYSYQTEAIWIHQLIGSQTTIPLSIPVSLYSESSLPWQGTYSLQITTSQPQAFKINLRIPSWANQYSIQINQQEWLQYLKPSLAVEPTANGYDPRHSHYIPIERTWEDGDTLHLNLELSIQVHHVHPKVKSCLGKAALSYGPIVFCLEGIDNPDINLETVEVDLHSLQPVFEPVLLGGVMTLQGCTSQGKPLKFIPYAWWANREISPMAVFFNC
ncbi:MAG: glycoside hydrolase family 127 protein [Anaerolineaceae bacterium]|nr:glycoside hydrolase family 127 protein [Anaerolineaceae bacterium]